MLLRRGEGVEKTVQSVELFLLVAAQFAERFRTVAVMRNVMDDGRVDEEREEPRGIGLQREFHHVKHQARLGHEFLRVVDVLGRLDGHDGLGLVFPFLGTMKALFEVADGRVVLVHAGLVGFGERAVQALGLITDEIEQTAALLQCFHVGRNFLGITLDEQFLK